jgi:hypothetical protein
MVRHLLWLLPALLATGACTEDKDTGATVPATEGAIQPEGDGVEMSADEACTWLLGAVERVHTRRGGCDDVERTCPEFILPAGGDADCVTFDSGSIKACVEVIDEYATCEDFALRPCIVTALNLECATGGHGGAGGAAVGGSAGAATGGSAGAATGGSAGAATGSAGAATGSAGEATGSAGDGGGEATNGGAGAGGAGGTAGATGGTASIAGGAAGRSATSAAGNAGQGGI